MGRKHRRSKNKVTWNFDDECSMLAFLEFRLGHGETDRVRNVEAIAQHLWQQRSKRFTASQVENRLNEIQHEATRKRRRGTIFDEGIRVLSNLPHSEDVRRLKQELEDEYLINMYSRDRVTRSTSHGLGPSQLNTRKRVLDTATPESPSPSPGRMLSTKRSRVNLSPREGTSPLARKSLLVNENSHRASTRTPSPKQEGDTEITPIPPNPTIRVIIPGSSDISTDEDFPSPSFPNERVSLNRNKTPSANSRAQKRATHNLDTTFQEVKIKTLEEEVKDLREKLSRQTKDRDHRESQTYTINSSLEMALTECQRKCAEYAEDVKCLKYTLSEKNPTDRKLLYQQERQIITLRNSMSERRQNAEFFQLSADQHYVPKQDEIHNAMYAIHHETKRILVSYDDNSTVRTPDLDHEDDLRSLLERTLGTDSSSALRPDTLKAVLERNGLQAVICALVAAALCEWVFATDFESTVAQPSKLLNMYRQHISSIDDSNALRNVDIAANKLLFSSDYYLNHAIPARAKELAWMLSNALAPLIPNAKDFSGRSTNSFHTWGEGRQESVRREKRFTDIFERALRLKADLVASTGLFSVVLYSHGTGFDKRFMIAETKYGDGAVMPSNTEPMQVCLLPAIYAHELPRQGVVDYKLEIRSEHPQGSDLRQITKAIAVLD